MVCSNDLRTSADMVCISDMTSDDGDGDADDGGTVAVLLRVVVVVLVSVLSLATPASLSFSFIFLSSINSSLRLCRSVLNAFSCVIFHGERIDDDESFMMDYICTGTNEWIQ